MVNQKDTFTEDTAKKLNKSQRTIQNNIKIATDLTDEAKDVIKEVGLKKTEALTLSRQDEEVQNKVA